VKVSFRPALSGDVPRGYALSSITSLTCTHFDPTIFLNFQKKVVVSHRANEPIYLAHGTSSDTSWKRATRVVTVRYRGKRIAGRDRVSVFGRKAALFFSK